MWIFARGNSFSTSSATALTNRIMVPAWLPSSASAAAQAGQQQGWYQSFMATEKMSQSGFSRAHFFTPSTHSLSTSGLVRHSWVRSFSRLPSTMEKYSGWVSKYFSTGTSWLKVWLKL